MGPRRQDSQSASPTSKVECRVAVPSASCAQPPRSGQDSEQASASAMNRARATLARHATRIDRASNTLIWLTVVCMLLAPHSVALCAVLAALNVAAIVAWALMPARRA